MKARGAKKGLGGIHYDGFLEWLLFICKYVGCNIK